MPITIVGAGFSGLSLAYELVELGLPVQILEAQDHVGGLISTRITGHGAVESAANAVLADRDLETLFCNLGIKMATPKPVRRKRYIFWHKPKRWPLSLVTTFKLCAFLMRRKAHAPKPNETIEEWATRTVNLEFAQRLLAPALQGIYAGDIQRLSATLILKRFFRQKSVARGTHRGSVSPESGMGELMDKLKQSLQRSGVTIRTGVQYTLPKAFSEPVVICTSAWSAAQILTHAQPEVAEKLKQCESLPLVSVTAFFKPMPSDLRGFGCLFPEAQGFHALGVLFNTDIFSGRSALRSETWIFGGAKNVAIIDSNDSEIVAALMSDRQRLMPSLDHAVAIHITRWPRAIPHYTVAWEQILNSLSVPWPLYLHGNYLGSLGLSQIYQRSKSLAREIKERYVG